MTLISCITEVFAGTFYDQPGLIFQPTTSLDEGDLAALHIKLNKHLEVAVIMNDSQDLAWLLHHHCIAMAKEFFERKLLSNLLG